MTSENVVDSLPLFSRRCEVSGNRVSSPHRGPRVLMLLIEFRAMRAEAGEKGFLTETVGT